MNALLIGISVLAAVAYGVVFATRPVKGLPGALVKTTAVGALALLALVLGLPLLVVAGLALGAFGDFALARPGEKWFLAGMAAFAAGHLAYVIQMAGLPQVPGPALWVWLPVGVLTLWALTWLAPKAGALRWPVSGYALIIGAMLGFALILAPGAETLKAGAVLFVLSDLLLSFRLFVVKDPGATRALDLALWPAYWGGQALILWGFVQVLGR
jgi:uncharacterized membrane protein YhhN